ncbi:MAG TPA: flagellar biosynthesis anti-sigma factor FlgM [Bryobacteraceae bacterium]|jgi:anti-sigma28 factor (negative regulator of flagellin synthesis)|nr:flagellar biosynthesis anti-sigma factor FlgM [Bryobacteraceae bacterium]
MQISNNSLHLPSLGPAAAAGQSQAPRSGAARSADGDRVELSSLASQLAADPRKLDQLQAAYRAGGYNLSPDRIAEGIINETLES